MQLKVTLTEKERQAFHHFVSRYNGNLPPWLAKIVKATNAPAPVKKKGAALWQVVNRPDLKTMISTHNFQNFLNADEPCAHCGESMRDNRVIPVSKYGDDFRLAHAACGQAYWLANSPYSGIANPDGNFLLTTYTEAETAHTAATARSIAKAA